LTHYGPRRSTFFRKSIATPKVVVCSARNNRSSSSLRTLDTLGDLAGYIWRGIAGDRERRETGEKYDHGYFRFFELLAQYLEKKSADPLLPSQLGSLLIDFYQTVGRGIHPFRHGIEINPEDYGRKDTPFPPEYHMLHHLSHLVNILLYTDYSSLDVGQRKELFLSLYEGGNHMVRQVLFGCGMYDPMRRIHLVFDLDYLGNPLPVQ